jgi:hypothetical protein
VDELTGNKSFPQLILGTTIERLSVGSEGRLLVKPLKED